MGSVTVDRWFNSFGLVENNVHHRYGCGAERHSRSNNTVAKPQCVTARSFAVVASGRPFCFFRIEKSEPDGSIFLPVGRKQCPQILIWLWRTASQQGKVHCGFAAVNDSLQLCCRTCGGLWPPPWFIFFRTRKIEPPVVASGRHAVCFFRPRSLLRLFRSGSPSPSTTNSTIVRQRTLRLCRNIGGLRDSCGALRSNWSTFFGPVQNNVHDVAHSATAGESALRLCRNGK